jgi:chromate reductase
MSSPCSVVVLVGSLRQDSINRKVARALIAQAPASLKPEIVEIGQLPLYNQDGDDNPPSNGWSSAGESVVPAPFCSSRRSTIVRFLRH